MVRFFAGMLTAVILFDRLFMALGDANPASYAYHQYLTFKKAPEGAFYIPSESDISLELLVDFYEDYLCKRIFIFTLRDGQVVKLFFRDATELFHVSGIDHVYEGVPMDGSRFIQEIKAGNIDLTTVKNVNAAAYKDYEIRVRSMACIDTIIKNCEYL